MCEKPLYKRIREGLMHVAAGAVLRGAWGGRKLPIPNLGLAPPINISVYRCKQERAVDFKIRQNSFPAGSPLRTLLGSSTDPL